MIRRIDAGSGQRRSGKSGSFRVPGPLLGLALVLAFLCPQRVQAATIELTPYAGYAIFDNELNLKDRVHYGGKLGFYFGMLGIEGNLGFTPGDLDTDATFLGGDNNVHILNYSGDLVFRFAPEAKVVPYLLAGVGVTDFQFGGIYGDTSRVSFDAGAGLLFRLADHFGLRFEGRDLMFKLGGWPASTGIPAVLQPTNDNLRHNFIITGGLSLIFGGTKDSDHDGVSDKNDRCPDTPAGAVVDAEGCPVDSDKDGVPDGIDQCPNTPTGATVDARGCPKDSDNDGVYDGIDQCPDTPAGVAVDSRGCPKDSDNDGVPDDRDQCPNTPAGVAVDERGCPKDSDNDGVSDDKDLCPNTPPGVRVDKDGCPIEISEKEVEMLDKGKITVRNIHFDTGKWDILPESETVLNELGAIFVQWPQLRIEIGGHTDARGSNAYNQDLSQKRAEAVRSWLLSHFPQLNADNFTAMGYGEGQPVASNKTQTGMTLNRRVEFKVLNAEELTKEKERRRLLKSGE